MAARTNSESFAKWLSDFNLEFLGIPAITAQHFPNLEVIDPPEVKALKTWLAIDGVKGYWDSYRAGAKIWNLPFDGIHEDVYVLLGARNLTMVSGEELYEFLFTIFGILPSDNINLAVLKKVLQLREVDEISRKDLLKLYDITSQSSK